MAVSTVYWSIPVRESNVHPVYGGARTAAGSSTTATSAGEPKNYRVASGDIICVAAQRFGISIQDLVRLNANLQVF